MATKLQIQQKAIDNLSDILANPKRKPSDIKAVVDLLIDNTVFIGEIKYLAYNLTERNAHFDTNGAGKSTSIWFGWQIMNGNGGTNDDSGLVHMNYKPGKFALGNQIGNSRTVLIAHKHKVRLPSTNGSGSSGGLEYPGANNTNVDIDTFIEGIDENGTASTTETGIDKNYQPTRVILAIQRMA